MLADFLEKIESARPSTPNLSLKLRMQIDRIDQCMKQTPQESQEHGLLSMGQNLLLGWRNAAGSPNSSNVRISATATFFLKTVIALNLFVEEIY